MDDYPMLKFNAHLGFQFNELPFLQRIEAAAAAGFRAVEFRRRMNSTPVCLPTISPNTVCR